MGVFPQFLAALIVFEVLKALWKAAVKTWLTK